MSRKVSYLGVLFLVTILSSVCFAKFTVYLTDGTSHEVSRVDFNAGKAQLFLVSGQKLDVLQGNIDFAKSGFKRPDASIASIYGTGSESSSSQSNAPTQAELEAIWNRAPQSVVAVNDFGSVVKGQVVRVVESSTLTTVVIEKDETTGIFKRIVLDTGSFAENFQRQAPARGQPKSTGQSSEPPARQAGSEPDLTFSEPEGNASSSEISDVSPPNATLIKIVAGIGLMAVVCIILLIKTHGILRVGILVAFLCGAAFSANTGYHEWLQYKKVDDAEGRVKTFFSNILDLSNEEKVQTAVAVWSRGTLTINNPTELAAAKSECLRWLGKGGIGIIKSFAVKGAMLQTGSSDSIVFVSIDDRLKKVLVSDGQSLSWAKKEQ